MTTPTPQLLPRPRRRRQLGRRPAPTPPPPDALLQLPPPSLEQQHAALVAELASFLPETP